MIDKENTPQCRQDYPGQHCQIMSTDEQSHITETHEHCDGCFRINCHMRPRPSFSCKVITCPVGCGHRFHGCKLGEHLQLCGEKKVACINRDFGCPLFVARKDRGRHLERCPASVVHCPMEWNRWPVYSQERQMRVPFVQEKLHAKFGQLDVALALRDQRILNEGFKAPRSTRRVLRNNLTLRFPAVPLKSPRSTLASSGGSVCGSKDGMQTESTLSDDDTDTPWGTAKNPPGLQRSVCNELFKATQTMAESLTTALSMTTGAAYGAQPDSTASDTNCNTEVDFKMESCEAGASSCYATMDNSPKFVDRHESVLEIGAASSGVSSESDRQREPPVPPVLPPTLKEILALDLTIERISRYQAKPKSMYTFLCASEFRRDEYPWHFLNVHNDIHSGLNGWLEQRCPLANNGCTYSLRRFYPNCKGSAVVYSPAVEAFGVQPYVPECHLQSKTSSKEYTPQDMHISDDVAMDDSERENTPEIYTSRNYDSYVKVKGDIESLNKVNGVSNVSTASLNNVNSVTRLSTASLDNVNASLDNICPLFNQSQDENSDGFHVDTNDTLSVLPFEVLQHIARFLDSFSLCNLALTSKLLRDVACSLLDEKGIVTQEWLRQKGEGRSHWYMGYKRWTYSLSFSPIKKWGFEDNVHMSEHLKSCPFFHRDIRTQPFFYPELGSKGTLEKRVFPNMQD